MVWSFIKAAGSLVEGLDKEDEVKLLRLRTKKNELVIVPGKETSRVGRNAPLTWSRCQVYPGPNTRHSAGMRWVRRTETRSQAPQASTQIEVLLSALMIPRRPFATIRLSFTNEPR